MQLKKRFAKGLLFFVLIVVISFLAWFILANITDQQIIAKECLYKKETAASLVTVGIVYIIRIIDWAV